MKKANKKGFTLVEIMIVVAIIGLLAAIGIPSIIGAYGNAQKKSKDRNIADVEKAKAMLTLPEGSSGVEGEYSYTNGQPVDASVLADALNLEGDDLSALTVGGTPITHGDIGKRAEY